MWGSAPHDLLLTLWGWCSTDWYRPSHALHFPVVWVWASAWPRVEASPGLQSSGVRLRLASHALSRGSLHLKRRGKGAAPIQNGPPGNHAPHLRATDGNGRTLIGAG